jgi:superfamily II DNA or RNA helicase
MADVTLFEEKAPMLLGITPREYQIEAHDNSLRLFGEGIPGVLLRMATGSGKTLTASMLARTWLGRGDDYRVMVISYETQLVWQFAKEIESFIGVQPGIEMEKNRADSSNKIVVASRQSLLQHPGPTKEQADELKSLGVTELGCSTKKMAESYLKYLRKGISVDDVLADIETKNQQPEASNGKWSRVHKFDWRLNWLIFSDECHRFAYHLKSVNHWVEWFEQNPNSKRAGLSATPKRSDGVSIGSRMFPGIAIDYPLFSREGRCALRDGYAVPYVQKYIELEGVDFKQIKRVTEGGDFDESALEKALMEDKELAGLVDPLLDMVGDRPTLIFNPGVEMAKKVARFINARCEAKCECGQIRWYPKQLVGDGATCECGRFIIQENITKSGDQAVELDGEVPHQVRDEYYRKFEEKKFQFLSVCGLCIAEGTLILTDVGDVPIEDVTTHMKVWDGVEFVSHDGVIFNGFKPVIEYAGLRATENHKVLTKSGWETIAECKKNGTPIVIGQLMKLPVQYSKESDFVFRDPEQHEQQPEHATEQSNVYDILNAGPRHRFTANGLLVSNCREGFDVPSIACVAVFRPVSKKASSLAEQMKGRSCRPLREIARILHTLPTPEDRRKLIEESEKPNALIVDLVGITGLADCASTVEIYAEGLPDEVIKRAEDILSEKGKDEEFDVQEAIDQAEKEDREAKEKIRKEREESERRAKEEFERRAQADPRAKYTTYDKGIGSQYDPNEASEGQYNLIKSLGMEIGDVISKRKAGRIINMLKQRTNPSEVAYKNGISSWEPTPPSPKQSYACKRLGYDVSTSYEASQILSAARKPQEFKAKKLADIQNAKNDGDLTAVGMDMKLVRRICPPDVWAEVVSAGARKRQELKSINSDDIPE